MENIVETRDGKVEGIKSDCLQVFKGIPYAAPPVGKLRFKPTQPVEPWGDVLKADAFGPDAPQDADAMAKFFEDPMPQSEDCLKLNVWTPGTDNARRPVMVWFHGGAFRTGGSARKLYDGSFLAKRGDVVIVSVNYRLGLLGFLAHPSLKDAQTDICANWGLLDQIAALEWVRDNIEGFGGDPNNVTIFGESAGGAAVGLLMVTPQAKGLFKRAVSQSCAPIATEHDKAFKIAEQVFDELAVTDGQDKKLREMPFEDILKVQLAHPNNRALTWPVTDKKVLPFSALDALNLGISDDIDFLMGLNNEEARFFLLLDPRRKKLDETQLLARLEKAVPGMHESGKSNGAYVMEAYRKAREERGDSTDPWDMWCFIHSDRMFREQILRFAAKQSVRNKNTYSYLFKWESPIKALGSCHALEIPFVFGTLGIAPGMAKFAGEGPEAERLSEIMQDSWLAFAKTGNPATEALGDWPAYDPKNRATMIFNSECGVENKPYEAERQVWDEVESPNFLNW